MALGLAGISDRGKIELSSVEQGHIKRDALTAQIEHGSDFFAQIPS